MTKIEMLCWGVQHIAQNHGFHSDVTGWETDGEVCIYGGNNVPTIMDVRMLCEDLGIEKKYVESSAWGIDIWIPSEEDWDGNEEYVQGLEFWRRVA